MPAAPRTLDQLPMFASDLDIATALVGRAEADKWVRFKLPTLEKKAGFPPIDEFHGGRPVPLVKRFYETYLGIQAGRPGKPDVKEDDSAWTRSRRQA